MADPYETLGVARSATESEIRSAYRSLARQHHPDLNPGDAKAEDRFKKISAANELLSDPERRARFDRGEIDEHGQEQAQDPAYRDHASSDAGRRYRQGGPQAGDWSDDDLSGIFGSMFGGGRRRSGQPMRGLDRSYSLTVDFLDGVNGASRRLTLPDGRTLDVKIPAGTADGLVLRLRGQGGDGQAGGPAGDALITIQVTSHPHFERSGNDIRMILPVTLAEAVVGGPVQVPTPSGWVKMQIPPHSDSGTELRLRGRGVPAHKGQAAGNLYARLSVVIGTRDAALEAFLKTWKPQPPPDPRQHLEDRP